MSNMKLIVSVIFLLHGSQVAVTAASSEQSPNILLIITDQQFAEAMSCAGNPHVQTPAIDGLAARGMRFTESYSTSPVCAPSRGSILTGLFPHQHGVTENGERIRSDLKEICIEHLLAGKGYECVYDLRNDRHETKNLAADSNYRDVLPEHRQRLAAWRKETGDTSFVAHAETPDITRTIDASQNFRAFPRLPAGRNTSIQKAPAPVLAEVSEREFGKARIAKCWLNLDEMWNYRTREYNYNYRIGVHKYDDVPEKHTETWGCAQETNVRFYDYLAAFGKHSDEVMLTIRRYERDILDGTLGVTMEDWKEIFKNAVIHYRRICPNLRYIEVCNEYALKGFIGCTASSTTVSSRQPIKPLTKPTGSWDWRTNRDCWWEDRQSPGGEKTLTVPIVSTPPSPVEWLQGGKAKTYRYLEIAEQDGYNLPVANVISVYVYHPSADYDFEVSSLCAVKDAGSLNRGKQDREPTGTTPKESAHVE